MSSASILVPAPNPTSAAWSIFVDNQNLNFTDLDGNITALPLVVINDELYLLITQDAVFGMTIGATGISLLVSFMFADAKKLRSPLFIVNSLKLLLEFVFAVV